MGNSSMAYRVIRSNRRSLAIQITGDGEVLVRVPAGMSEAEIRQFVESRHGWIEAHLPAPRPKLPPLTWAELQALGQQAVKAIPERVAFFAPRVGVTYGRITIRNQRTRWGRCSGQGNLNFNCLLMLAPPEVLDYVVVHELCHRKELNHSPRFWAEVARVLPDYKARQAWLKEHGGALMGRLPETS